MKAYQMYLMMPINVLFLMFSLIFFDTMNPIALIVMLLIVRYIARIIMGYYKEIGKKYVKLNIWSTAIHLGLIFVSFSFSFSIIELEVFLYGALSLFVEALYIQKVQQELFTELKRSYYHIYYEYEKLGAFSREQRNYLQKEIDRLRREGTSKKMEKIISDGNAANVILFVQFEIFLLTSFFFFGLLAYWNL